MQARLIAVLAGFALATGCSPYVRRGEALYHEGRFIEAAEVFELTEQNLQESPPALCAEYSLYRGLTFLRLDDLESARVWLARAQSLDQKNPGILSPVQHALLARGRSELDQRLASAPVAPHPGTRFAASEVPTPATRTPVAPSGNGHRAIAPE